MPIKVSKRLFNYLTCGKCLKDMERLLAFIVIIGVIAYGIIAITLLLQMDWTQLATYREMLKLILELAIGVELARLLLSYNLDTVVELLAFVVARKLVLLENDFVSLLIGILALTILFAGKGILTYIESKEERLRQRKIENDEVNDDEAARVIED